jgi:hypothetical protein
MLVNLTNHKFSEWPPIQQEVAAQQFGEVVDLVPPPIPPEASTIEVLQTARLLAVQAIAILDKGKKEENGALVSGEFTFIWCCINLLHQKGIRCYTATTPRDVEESTPNQNTKNYAFVQFREYPNFMKSGN